METVPVLKSKAQDLVDVGIYEATLREVNVAEGEKGEYLQWEFDLTDEGVEGMSLRANSSMAFGPRSKARPWVEAMLRRKLSKEEGIEGVDTDKLVGSKVMLSVVHKETDDGTFARVDSVLRSKK